MIKNSYYETDRNILIREAGTKLKDDLQAKKVGKTDKEFYTIEELMLEVKEIDDLKPLLTGEIHQICIYAGVEFIND